MRRVNQTVDFSALSAGAKQAAQKELILLKNNEAEVILHTIKEEEGWLTTAILFLTYILTYIRSIRSRSAGGTESIMCSMDSIPYILGHAEREYVDQLIEMYPEIRNPYAQSMACVALGVQEREDTLPLLLREYERLKRQYPEESYCQGPLLAIYILYGKA